MHKILLVDDEPRQLRSLAAIIRRLRPQYEVMEAHTGREALHLTKMHTFDAVVSDIRMPEMDGLELMDNLYRRQYNAILVLLTGYKDFEYARKAISWGIMDYIVKPITRNVLEGMLKRLDDRFSTAHEERNSMKRMAKKLDLSLPVYQTYLLNKWIRGRMNEEEREALREIIPNDSAGIIGHLECAAPNELRVDVQQVQKLLQDRLISNTRNVYVFPLEGAESKLGLVFLLHPQPNYSTAFVNLAQKLDEWIADVEEELGWNMQMGLSDWSECIFDESETCNRHAETAGRRQFYEPNNRTVIYREISQLHDAVPDWIKVERDIADAIKKSNVHKWISAVNELMGQLLRSRNLPPELIKNEIAHLLFRLAKNLIHAYSEEQFACLAEEIRTNIMACMNAGQLRSRTKGIIERVAEAYLNATNDPADEAIRKCLSYVDECYVQDLSLDELAARFHFSPSYFSSLFKQRTGFSLSMYITKRRMEEAKCRLLQTDDSISDTARHVGYKDASYFIRIFKRETGVSPYKFRHMDSQI